MKNKRSKQISNQDVSITNLLNETNHMGCNFIFFILNYDRSIGKLTVNNQYKLCTL
jgi:hypothetical protein